MILQADGLASNMSHDFAVSIDKVTDYLSRVALLRPAKEERVSFACKFFGLKIEKPEGMFALTKSI
jgi:hypothetical protein